MNCLKEGKMNSLTFGPLDYQSSFDGVCLTLHLCDDCYEKLNPPIKERKVISTEEYREQYEHEDEMLKYFESLPLPGQELLYNRFGDTDAVKMAPQDWIDYKLKELSHEKCKRYILISPEEEKAYMEQFPICARRCLVDSFGGQTFEACSINHVIGPVKPERIYPHCYKCPYFKQSGKEPLLHITHIQWENLRRCTGSYMALIDKGFDPEQIIQILKDIS